MKFKKQSDFIYKFIYQCHLSISFINVIYKSVYRKEFSSLHQSTYKYALEKSCDQEKNSDERCRKFVDKYFDKIYAKDLTDLGPSYCVDIGACSATESTKEADLNENVYVL